MYEIKHIKTLDGLVLLHNYSKRPKYGDPLVKPVIKRQTLEDITLDRPNFSSDYTLLTNFYVSYILIKKKCKITLKLGGAAETCSRIDWLTAICTPRKPARRCGLGEPLSDLMASRACSVLLMLNFQVFAFCNNGIRVVRSPQFGFSEANAQAGSFGGGYPHYHHHHRPEFGNFGGGGFGGGHRGFGGRPGFGGGPRGFGGGPEGFGGGPGGFSGGPGGFGRPVEFGPGGGFGGLGYGQIPQGSISIAQSISINSGGGGGTAQSSASAGAFGK
ncbi:unnamed protein product [Parnassius apollo]|uniref:(apollo) hypothetical protein n=1 Tax=Parnassius apollo TaxID=110799 RepID=A0A8S3WW88_PARAO|nr:unnamed protein product [Parnassius apollo]